VATTLRTVSDISVRRASRTDGHADRGTQNGSLGFRLTADISQRQAAFIAGLGAPKPTAVAAIISDHAPWTKTVEVPAHVTTPSALAQAIVEADLVIDTTGGDAASQAICLAALAQYKKVVSGALYRGGSVARVRRQAVDGDVPILERTPAMGYPAIPPGSDNELIQPAVGCSGPCTMHRPLWCLAQQR
jgi:hypothetical protein